MDNVKTIEWVEKIKIKMINKGAKKLPFRFNSYMQDIMAETHKQIKNDISLGDDLSFIINNYHCDKISHEYDKEIPIIYLRKSNHDYVFALSNFDGTKQTINISQNDLNNYIYYIITSIRDELEKDYDENIRIHKDFMKRMEADLRSYGKKIMKDSEIRDVVIRTLHGVKHEQDISRLVLGLFDFQQQYPVTFSYFNENESAFYYSYWDEDIDSIYHGGFYKMPTKDFQDHLIILARNIARNMGIVT